MKGGGQERQRMKRAGRSIRPALLRGEAVARFERRQAVPHVQECGSPADGSRM